MVKLKINVKSIDDVNKLNQICSRFDFDIDLIGGKYYVNAKSIMGIFSLDLSQTLQLVAMTEDEATIKEAFNAFIV